MFMFSMIAVFAVCKCDDFEFDLPEPSQLTLIAEMSQIRTIQFDTDLPSLPAGKVGCSNDNTLCADSSKISLELWSTSRQQDWITNDCSWCSRATAFDQTTRRLTFDESALTDADAGEYSFIAIYIWDSGNTLVHMQEDTVTLIIKPRCYGLELGILED